MSVYQCPLHPYRCNCTFIPPYALENLARAGRENARLTIQQSRLSRSKRTNTLVPMAQFTGVAAAGESHRIVFNCKTLFQQRMQPPVREEGGPPTGDEAADLAYDYGGVVRDYFKTMLNRNSIDNVGMDLILNVHHGANYNNAFWDGDEMTFGDGDGKLFTSFARSLDVVAHELAHGVTQFTANLEYRSQSGALNEHFSDVFGSVITQYHNNQTAHDADWLIGDEIMGPELYGEALRSMKEPGTAYDNALLGKDPQPADMSKYYSGQDDNQGVHINSGIPNKAFYLVAMEIGTDKAAFIWYQALQKLWPTAKFNDAVKVITDAARDLTRDGKVPLGSPQTVRSAFREVGLPS